MTATFHPTEEQQAIHDALFEGQDIVVNALAGTGKTSTLRWLAETLKNDGYTCKVYYIAFNRSVRDEAKATFPSNTKPYTASSFAFGQMCRLGKGWIRDRISRDQKKTRSSIAQDLDLHPITFRDPLDPKKVHTLSPIRQVSILNSALSQFCQSLDANPSPRHFTRQQGFDKQGEWENHRVITGILLPHLWTLWDDVRKEHGTIGKFTHETYMKMWHLMFLDADKYGSIPPLFGRQGDIVFYDEAQDANAVISDILSRHDHLQRIYVGDENQAIYGFTGAVDTLGQLARSDEYTVLSLTKSWRFGQEVADAANALLTELGSKYSLVGNENKTSHVIGFTDRHAEEPMVSPGMETFSAIIGRNNVACLEAGVQAWQEGRIAYMETDIFWIQNFLDAAECLMNGRTPKMMELSIFDSWGELKDYMEQDEAEYPTEWDRMVKLIDRYDVNTLRQAVASFATNPRDADLVITTAHKSKGLQWSSVMLLDDLDPRPQEGFGAERISIDENGLEKRDRTALMLAYVALTRGEDLVDPSIVLTVQDASGKPHANIFDYLEGRKSTTIVPKTEPSTPATEATSTETSVSAE